MNRRPKSEEAFQGFLGKRVLLRGKPLLIERIEVQRREVHFFARREVDGAGCWLRLHQVLTGLED